MVDIFIATSVYGDHKGDWVNEKVLLNQHHQWHKQVKGRKCMEKIINKNNYPLQIFRLAEYTLMS